MSKRNHVLIPNDVRSAMRLVEFLYETDFDFEFATDTSEVYCTEDVGEAVYEALQEQGFDVDLGIVCA